MTNSPESESLPSPETNNLIQQDITKNQGQAIAQMIGGVAVGQLTVYLSQIPTESTIKTTTTPSALGENPYQGLKTFREADGDRFFGRDDEIQKLLNKFQKLYEDLNTVRILPIFGPSGSGKSSLARAGLIPALGKQSFLGKDRCRVVVLTPGERPLEALATVLARIAINDPFPVAKTREFQEELIKLSSDKEFHGLRRIANVFPDINFSPLIILVDQFEEIYTYQAQQGDSKEKIHELQNERLAFVENLLCAASDRSQNVSVILTLRSDFLGKTQQHPKLNKLFSSQGFLVPIMQREQLAIAISEPAKQAGYELDRATISLLVNEAQGQEGGLPLLQFALTQIWEGLPQVTPADTLDEIGGVGGALASEARRLYESLNSKQQQIARCTFLALVQLNDENKSTRRRATISELVTSDHNEQSVREVINCFAKPGVWILVTSSNKQEIEMVEIAHEALINNWKELKEWLDLQWESIRKKRKIEITALEWEAQQKSKDYLLQGRILRDAIEFQKAQKENPETALSNDAKEFVDISQKKQRVAFLKIASLFLIFPIIATLGITHFFVINLAESVLKSEKCEQNAEVTLLLKYMLLVGKRDKLEEINLCKESLIDINLKEATLFKASFQWAYLEKINFQSAYLRKANFKGAYLDNVDFSDSNLVEANFQGAILTRVNLEKAKYISEDQVSKGKLCNTKLPKSFTINPNRDC